jgi:transcriptional regulator with XRE-family HTH domain
VDISEIRRITKLSQRQFAEYFGIPVGTLRNWEQGISTPPNYVFQMIITRIRRDTMINIETMKFIKLLDKLAELSLNGIESFDDANESTYRTKIFYDPIVAQDEKGYKVVADACVIDDPMCYHHDIISYYDRDSFEYTIRVMIDEDGAYIKVELLKYEDIIIIENGNWYFTK